MTNNDRRNINARAYLNSKMKAARTRIGSFVENPESDSDLARNLIGYELFKSLVLKKSSGQNQDPRLSQPCAHLSFYRLNPYEINEWEAVRSRNRHWMDLLVRGTIG